jgi:hypothetical protein
MMLGLLAEHGQEKTAMIDAACLKNTALRPAWPRKSAAWTPDPLPGRRSQCNLPKEGGPRTA